MNRKTFHVLRLAFNASRLAFGVLRLAFDGRLLAIRCFLSMLHPARPGGPNLVAWLDPSLNAER